MVGSLSFAALPTDAASVQPTNAMTASDPTGQATLPAAASSPSSEDSAASPSNDSGRVNLDRIVAVVNNDIITEYDLQQRLHSVALNLRRQNVQLPPMQLLRAQVLERLITERATLQRAQQTGIRVDDQMVNASIAQIAQNNHITVDELRQHLLADGVTFAAFRNQIRDEILIQRLREREVDSKIDIPESEVDAYLAQRAGFTGNDTNEYELAHIVLPLSANEDASKVQTLAQSIADLARKGKDFGSLVAAYSKADDAQSGGNLGWNTAQDLAPEVWNAIKQNKNVGAVSIVKDDHSIQIYKIVDRRDGVEAKLSNGPVVQTHVRHILMVPNQLTSAEAVQQRLADIKKRIESGQADFGTMARLNSVDGSATRGGDLGWLQDGDTVPEFQKAMNALKVGQISDPVKTPYGYHLIQVLERRTQEAGNPQRLRLEARQQLRQKKLAEATYNWQRELRDQAYVDIRDPSLKPQQ